MFKIFRPTRRARLAGSPRREGTSQSWTSRLESGPGEQEQVDNRCSTRNHRHDYDLGDDGRLERPLHQPVPVESLIPSVTLDVCDTVLLVTQSLCRILAAEAFDDGDCRLSHVTGEVQLIDSAQDDVVDLHRVGGGERGTSESGMPYVCVRPKKCYFKSLTFP